MNRIGPGMRCMIIGTHPGCEQNFGATLTTVSLEIWEDGLRRWTFTDADRPLLMRGKTSGALYWLHEIDQGEYAIAVRESQLVPLENPDETLSFLTKEPVPSAEEICH